MSALGRRAGRPTRAPVSRRFREGNLNLNPKTHPKSQNFSEIQCIQAMLPRREILEAF